MTGVPNGAFGYTAFANRCLRGADPGWECSLSSPLTTTTTRAGDGDVDLGRIERMLALAWESGAQPIVILTKSDAVEYVADTVAAVQAIARGCSVLAISAMTGDALDILTAMLDGTIVLIGPSGQASRRWRTRSSVRKCWRPTPFAPSTARAAIPPWTASCSRFRPAAP